LRLRRLDKVLYPATGTTKGEVLDYYARVAPLMLPHLARRPVTRKRWPDGVRGGSFFEKNLPRGTPPWVASVTLPTPGSSSGRDLATFPIVQDVATLVWLINLASLELHVPQWQVGPRGAVKGPDRLVIDLDPGEPAGLESALRWRCWCANGLPRTGSVLFRSRVGARACSCTRRSPGDRTPSWCAGTPRGWPPSWRASAPTWSSRG
jgi:DNA ligase D-like protein (predicted polymerase)